MWRGRNNEAMKGAIKFSLYLSSRRKERGVKEESVSFLHCQPRPLLLWCGASGYWGVTEVHTGTRSLQRRGRRGKVVCTSQTHVTTVFTFGWQQCNLPKTVKIKKRHEFEKSWGMNTPRPFTDHKLQRDLLWLWVYRKKTQKALWFLSWTNKHRGSDCLCCLKQSFCWREINSSDIFTAVSGKKKVWFLKRSDPTPDSSL